MNPYEYVKNEPYKCYINGEFVIPEGEKLSILSIRQIMNHLQKPTEQVKEKWKKQ